MAADQQIEGLFSQGTFSSSPASRNSWSTGVLHRILAWLPEWGVCMNRIVLWALLMTTTMLAAQTQIATTPPPPQSARQALLEMFLGQGPDHLKKHLPEVTKKAFAKIESGSTPSFLTEVEAIGKEATAGGGNLQTMETGPVLLVTEQPQNREKFEITVERDDLVGDEDQIDLSFQMSRNGKPEALPFLPRLTFMMQ